jgi:hypothetical protein
MSQIDEGEDVLSGTTAEQDGLSKSRLVPVAESIRYRKRAQSAEKTSETLAEQLAAARSEMMRMAEQLKESQVEQKLVHKLAAAGATDLETATLIAKARMGSDAGTDLDDVIDMLKKEKQYLFVKKGDRFEASAPKTAGAREREQGGRGVLDKAAKRAAMTGNRMDLHEYMRLRRNFV